MFPEKILSKNNALKILFETKTVHIVLYFQDSVYNVNKF